MRTLYKACLLGSTMMIGFSAPAFAGHEGHAEHSGHSQGHHDHNAASGPVPLAVMGDHVHGKGDWMVSYSYSHMEMKGNRQGTDSISPQEIVTTITNPNAPPPTLRVVPTKMEMDMHMFGAMYGVTDKLTLMGMAMYMKNDMEHLTFQGMAGTTELGRFTTRSSGWGDTKLSGIYNVYTQDNIALNLSAGISAPTGSIKEEDDVLTPMNTRPTLRLPYAMQLGSGTWDALLGATYSGHKNQWNWGAQYKATIRMESENDQGYRLGNKHGITAWGGYKFTPSIGISGKIDAAYQGKIKGSDANITAPVQTANPDNYGGKTVDVGIGLHYTPQYHAFEGVEIAAEIGAPVYQNLNGVQMERDWNFGLRLRKSF